MDNKLIKNESSVVQPVDSRDITVENRLEIIDDYDRAMAVTRQLSLKYTDDIAYIDWEIRESGKNTLVFRLVPEHITGKLVNES